MDQKNISIRLMTEADLEPIMVLKNLLGWNQTEADWKALINFEPKGCFVATQKDVVVGTATTTSYGADLAWIGMVIVHPEKRNLGIGKDLLQACLQYLNDNRVSCIKLDATPMGKKLYITFGFRDEFTLKRMKGKVVSLKYDSPSLTSFDLEKVQVFDKKYFVADRGRLLKRFYNEFPDLAIQSVDNNGNINGYLMARVGQSAYYVGPVVSESEEISKNLFSKLFYILNGKEVILDIGEHHTELIKFFAVNGFEVQRELDRMSLGDNPFSIKDEFIIASSSAEKG